MDGVITGDPLPQLDLPLYHELPIGEQQRLWDAAAGYFELENERFAGHQSYPDLAALDSAVSNGELVAVQSSADFGLVTPIRDRYDLNGLDETHGSIPYLRPEAREVLVNIAADCQVEAIVGGFRDELREIGFKAFRISVTSLTRSNHYQNLIAEAGKFARGRDGQPAVSTHVMGRALDIDHAGFYVTDSRGQEKALNPLSAFDDRRALAGLLPTFRQLLKTVVETYESSGEVIALHEIPDGWGVYHTAVLAA